MKNGTRIFLISLTLLIGYFWMFYSSIGRPSNWTVLMMEWDYRNGDHTNAIHLAGYHYDNGNFERASTGDAAGYQHFQGHVKVIEENE